MFEEEAEEYAENREVCGLLDAISENLQNYDYGTVAHYNIDPLVEECFQDGAEYGYNKCKEEMQKNGLALQSDMDKTIEQNIQLKKQIEKMKKYIKACWVEENLNDYSSYITNTSDEFRELVKELNDEVINGR